MYDMEASAPLLVPTPRTPPPASAPSRFGRSLEHCLLQRAEPFGDTGSPHSWEPEPTSAPVRTPISRLGLSNMRELQRIHRAGMWLRLVLVVHPSTWLAVRQSNRG
jgi:hypothetical protein